MKLVQKCLRTAQTCCIYTLFFAKHEKALHKNVECAAFAVLKSPDIPSVLVETAFISNPREEKRLRTAAFQNEVATSLHQGLINYCDDNRAAMNLVVS